MTTITAPATPEAVQWDGWKTALKPAIEHWILARKPFKGTVAACVLEHGTGALNVGACMVPRGVQLGRVQGSNRNTGTPIAPNNGFISALSTDGYPANFSHDGSPAVLAEFAKAGERSNGGQNGTSNRNAASGPTYGVYDGAAKPTSHAGSSGSAARFFETLEPDPDTIIYEPKAPKADRDAGLPSRCKHPTIKSTALMRRMCRLITPPGGLVLDMFAGAGSTGRGAVLEGFSFVGIEREAEYCEIARARIKAAREEAGTLTADEAVKGQQLGMFGEGE